MNLASFERGALILSVICLIGAVFLPLIIISSYEVPSVGSAVRGASVTFGIGVVLRATLRRIFRSASRSLLRTTVSTVTRASARTFTRRMLRLSLRTLFGTFVKQVGDSGESGEISEVAVEGSEQNPWWALSVSFVVLCVSFYVVVAILPEEWSAPITTDRGIPLWTTSLLAGLPVLLLGLLAAGAARLAATQVRFSVALDAILLQAYFTGAGSFLPMTTDILFEGGEATRARASTYSLVSLYLLHLLFFVVGAASGIYLVQFFSAMLLIYVFVYAFPIAPMPGYDVWRISKSGWCLLFAPMLYSLLQTFPPEFAELV